MQGPSFLFVFFFFFRFFFPFNFISWKIITLQYCSGFCHTLTWISHGFTCVPHPNPPSRLLPHPIPLGLPSAPAPSTCLMHPIWAGDLSYPWQYTCFNAILSEHLNTQGPSYIYLVPKKKKMLSNPWFPHPDTSQTAQKKVLKNDGQRKMTHYLHVYFSLLRFFKICMIIKSKNDKIFWWDFQNMYYEIHTTTK